MPRTISAVIGFLLLFFGFLSLILGFIGLGLYPISIIDKSMSPMFSLIFKLVILVAGFVIFYVSTVRHPEEEKA